MSSQSANDFSSGAQMLLRLGYLATIRGRDVDGVSSFGELQPRVSQLRSPEAHGIVQRGVDTCSCEMSFGCWLQVDEVCCRRTERGCRTVPGLAATSRIRFDL